MIKLDPAEVFLFSFDRFSEFFSALLRITQSWQLKMFADIWKLISVLCLSLKIPVTHQELSIMIKTGIAILQIELHLVILFNNTLVDPNIIVKSSIVDLF